MRRKTAKDREGRYGDFCDRDRRGQGRDIRRPHERGGLSRHRAKNVFQGASPEHDVSGRDRLRRFSGFRDVRLLPRAEIVHGRGCRRISLPRRQGDRTRRSATHDRARRPSCGEGRIYKARLFERQTLPFGGGGNGGYDQRLLPCRSPRRVSSVRGDAHPHGEGTPREDPHRARKRRR